MKKLSEKALSQCGDVIDAIKKHPFNTELANGSLNRETFAYYIEQDAIYLRDFAKSLALIAGKVPVEFMKDFISFSEVALIAEQEVVHKFFKNTFNLKETGKLTPATLSYTSYLLQVAHMAPVEVAIASILPCFWVYNLVGQSISQNADTAQNPYKQWIETYAGEEFSKIVQRAIDIFDEVARSASENVRTQMLEAFYKSTVLEWHFWNDAYNNTVFDLCERD